MDPYAIFCFGGSFVLFLCFGIFVLLIVVLFVAVLIFVLFLNGGGGGWVSFLFVSCLVRACNRSSDRSFMVDTLSYFSFQPVPHDWCNKDRGMYYNACGMMHIKEPFLLI